MVTLSMSAPDHSPSLVTLQCDVCCPPNVATNPISLLEGVGWTTRAGGHSLDVCPICHRRRLGRDLVPRRERRLATEGGGGALPNLMVIGAAKCGTNTLHALLDAHPDVAMSVTKELLFFSDPEGAEWLDFYRAQFDPSAEVRGESTTAYSRFPLVPDVPERMAKLIPDARIVYMVRDPVQRAISGYVEERTHNNESRSLEDAFADLEDPYNPYLAASRYAMQLQRYLDHFPRQHIFVLPLEELEADSDLALERVLTFLGVDPVARPTQTDVQLNAGSAKREYPPLVRRLRSSSLLKVAYLAPPGARERVLQPLRQMLSRPLGRPAVTPELRARLCDALADDAVELRALTGQQLPDWCV